MPQEHRVRETTKGDATGRVLTVTVRPPLSKEKAPLSYYGPDETLPTGYSRLSAAILEALNLRRVSADMRPDITLAAPCLVAHERLRFTMWEPSRLPKRVVGYQAAQSLIVPCRHNVDVFRSSGYDRPISVVPLWGDAKRSPMPTSGPFRFICVAKENGVPQRKGIPQLIDCFKKAFPRNRDVRLTLKRSPECSRIDESDPRIEILDVDLTKPEYETLISKHHCGVFLSGLEGWNFPACELMAAGRPSIIIPYGGPADFTTPQTSWHLPFSLVEAPSGHPYYSTGHGALADNDAVISSMKEAFENWSMLKTKAEYSASVADMYTKEHFALRLRSAVLDLLGRL